MKTKAALHRQVTAEEVPPPDYFSRFHVRRQEVPGLSLTETSHPPDFEIPAHEHAWDSVYLVLGGSLTERFGRHSAEREAGDLVFTPAGESHSDVFARGGGRCFIAEFQPENVARVRECGELPEHLVSFRHQPAWLAGRLYREFLLGDALSPLTMECLTVEMLAEICRERSRRATLGPRSSLTQALEFLEAHLVQSVSLAEMARAVGLHPVYLARLFRRHYGYSVGDFVRRRRVERACAQLSSSRTPLSQVALDCGFCDQPHFTRTFHQLTGLTPSQYRTALRGEQPSTLV